MSEKRVRLTKKREDALDCALNFDEILYEKFRRLNDQLHREADRLFRHRKRMMVVQRQDGLVFEQLQVESVEFGPDFTRVIVR